MYVGLAVLCIRCDFGGRGVGCHQVKDADFRAARNRVGDDR